MSAAHQLQKELQLSQQQVTAHEQTIANLKKEQSSIERYDQGFL